MIPRRRLELLEGSAVAACAALAVPIGLTALALVVAALLLGGSQVDVGSLAGARYLGLDWFLLNLLVFGMLYGIPGSPVPRDDVPQLLYPFRRR